MIEMSKINKETIKDFYRSHNLALSESMVDFDLLDALVPSRTELYSQVSDIIDTGHIVRKASIRFNLDDAEDTVFVLITKDTAEINLEVLIMCLSEAAYKIVSVYPNVINGTSHKDGCYYPEIYDLSGKTGSAIGLCVTDVFDTHVLFERDYFEDNNADHVEWNLFGITLPDSIGSSRYSAFDGVDEIYPRRKVSVCTDDMETVNVNGIVLHKCYADAALFPEYVAESPAQMGIRIPLYISEKVCPNVHALNNGMELNAIIFGNIKNRMND